jgi:hypothetical protein
MTLIQQRTRLALDSIAANVENLSDADALAYLAALQINVNARIFTITTGLLKQTKGSIQ